MDACKFNSTNLEIRYIKYHTDDVDNGIELVLNLGKRRNGCAKCYRICKKGPAIGRTSYNCMDWLWWWCWENHIMR